MANSYTQTSFEVTADSRDIDMLVAILEAIEQYTEMEDPDAWEAWRGEQDAPSSEVFEAVAMFINEFDPIEWGGLGIEYSRENDETVWIRDEESAIIDGVVAALQAWMRMCDIDESVSFTWASICSESYVGAFSGGGIVVTKSDDYCMNAERFAFQAAAGTLLPPVSAHLAQLYKEEGWTTKDALELLEEFISSEPDLRSRFAGFITEKANEDDN